MKTEDMVLNKGNKSFLERHQDVFALLCLVGCVALFYWKAPFGLGAWDESWYLTFGHRFAMGDSMVVDEWNVIQLFSFFLYLPVRIYLSIVGSTEGIILSFRYLYIIFQSASTLAVYLLSRKYGPISILSSVMLFLFVPASIMAVCYYSLTTVLCLLIGLLLAARNYTKKTLLVVGGLFACLVLCNPFLALVYFIYTMTVLLIKLLPQRVKRWSVFEDEYISLRSWSWITIGIAVVAVVFIAFLLSGTTIREILANLPQVFGDSDYNIFSTQGRTQNIVDLRQSAMEIVNINPYLLTAFIVSALAIILDKKRVRHRLYHFIVVLAIVFVFIVYLVSTSNLYKYLLCMFPLTLLGLTSHILCERKNNNVFVFMWLWGIVVAFFQDVSSNQGTRLMSIGLATSCLASIILAKGLLEEMKSSVKKKTKKPVKNGHRDKGRRVAVGAFITLVLCQISFQLYVNVAFETMSAEYFYHDLMEIASEKEDLDTTIEKGPAKGLITTKSTAESYSSIIKDLSYIKNSGNGGPVLVLGQYPWAYLYVDNPYATYSTTYLYFKFSETMDRHAKYFELHPEKFPEYIYLPNDPTLYIPNRHFIEQSKRDITSASLLYVEEKYNCMVTEGSAGYIIKILK